MKLRPTSLVCTAAIWAETCRHPNPFARPGNTFLNCCINWFAGILLPHNESRLRLVTYPRHWTKDREVDVVASVRIGKVAWAVDFR